MTWARVVARSARTAGTFATAFLTWLTLAGATLAASPSPDPIVGDPRSSGQGPGLVGDPLFAVFAVVAIGLGAVALTLVYVRLTARRGD